MSLLRRRVRPDLDLAVLDRLSDTIARAVALIEERLAPTPASEEPRPAADLVIHREPSWADPVSRSEDERRSTPEPLTEPEPAPEPVASVEPLRAVEPAAGFVLFVPTSAGYRLAAPATLVPEPGERVRVDDDWYRVLRLGPSPLPGDRRRCAFLEATLG